MPKDIKYPSEERIIELNFLALSLIKAKKSDQPQTLSRTRLTDILEKCKTQSGDVYQKAMCLLKELVKRHPFASGNRRTAILAAKEFVVENSGTFKIENRPEQAQILIGIREEYYTDQEIREWIQYGKIRSFERFKR